MKFLEQLKNIDIYLLDQIQKGRVTKATKILDAGCGKGRNSYFLLDQGFDVWGCDPLSESIEELHNLYPSQVDRYTVSSIEEYPNNQKFDFIICNAVLHFAQSHEHFQLMMKSMSDMLSETGVLFIRMTSDFAIHPSFGDGESGRVQLPDGTTRYLLNRTQLTLAISQNQLKFVEPLKTVNVDDQRCMSTLVLTRDQDVKLDLGWVDKSQNPMME